MERRIPDPCTVEHDLVDCDFIREFLNPVLKGSRLATATGLTRRDALAAGLADMNPVFISLLLSVLLQ